MTKSANPDCTEVLATISSYLDGELDATGCEAVERHSQQCESCAELVKGLRETVGLCRQAGSMPLPESVRQRARERVRRLLERHESDSGI